MSETSTNLLTGFQATTSRGGDLLADSTLVGGETTEDSAVSFSNVLNQAQSNQADDVNEDTTRLAERAGRLVRDSGNGSSSSMSDDVTSHQDVEPSAAQQSTIDGETNTTRGSTNDNIESLNNPELRRTLDALEESTELTDSIEPGVRPNQLNEDVALVGSSELATQRNNGHRLVSPDVVDPSTPVEEGDNVALPSVTVETSSDIAANRDTSNSQPQIAGAADTTITSPTLRNAETEESFVGEGTQLQGTAVSAPIVGESDAVQLASVSRETVVTPSVLVAGAGTQSPSANVNDQPPVVSAAAVANRLNVQPFASAMPVTGQPDIIDAAPKAGTEAEQLTTIAAIQSVQAGITGLAQASATSSTAISATALGAASTESTNLSIASLAPAAANASASATPATLTGEPLATGSAGAANPGVNSVLNGASNISPLAAKELPMPPSVIAGTSNSATTGNLLNTQLPVATPALAAANESSSTFSLNPALDNMLSAPASGIVTAPILAKADLTGTPLVQTPLNVPLLTPAATDAMAGNVRWMVGEGVQNAVVNVSPHGMGPISVQIGIEKEQMSISIVASQSTTREALESMLPRLRDQLSTQGVETVRVDISDGRGERSGNFAGFERQNMGYTTADNGQNSQQRSTDEKGQENSSMDFNDSQTNESGERTLSESERALVDQLKNSSTHSSVKNVSISHGYDLYV